MKTFLAIVALVLCSNLGFAHSGRTDGQGGHNDRKHGGYHFHHGMGPHDHPNGVCPYRQSAVRKKTEGNFVQRHPILTCLGAGILSISVINYFAAKDRKKQQSKLSEKP